MIENKKLIEQYSMLHENVKDYGTTSLKYLESIQKVVDQFLFSNIIDYGCGKSLLIDNIKNVQYKMRYDPAIKKYSDNPIYAEPDLIICTDVLEHIPEDDVSDFIENLRTISDNAILAISYRESYYNLPNGEPCHCTVKSPQWWYRKIKESYLDTFIVLEERSSSELLFCRG